MILIRSIDWIETVRDPMEIVMTEMPHASVFTKGCSSMASVEEIRELVRGRRYVRPSDGTDITVGMTSEAAKVIGIQYEAWEAIESELSNANKTIIQANNDYTMLDATYTLLFIELNAIKSEGLWKRIRRLFKKPSKT